MNNDKLHIYLSSNFVNQPFVTEIWHNSSCGSTACLLWFELGNTKCDVIPSCAFFFHKIGVKFIESLGSLSGRNGQTGILWESQSCDCSAAVVLTICNWWIAYQRHYGIIGVFPLQNHSSANHSAPWGVLVLNYMQLIHKM